jgi:hypothetical protein
MLARITKCSGLPASDDGDLFHGSSGRVRKTAAVCRPFVGLGLFAEHFSGFSQDTGSVGPLFSGRRSACHCISFHQTGVAVRNHLLIFIMAVRNGLIVS